jgi:hypothetical protein
MSCIRRTHLADYHICCLFPISSSVSYRGAVVIAAHVELKPESINYFVEKHLPSQILSANTSKFNERGNDLGVVNNRKLDTFPYILIMTITFSLSYCLLSALPSPVIRLNLLTSFSHLSPKRPLRAVLCNAYIIASS